MWKVLEPKETSCLIYQNMSRNYLYDKNKIPQNLISFVSPPGNVVILIKTKVTLPKFRIIKLETS